MKQNSKEEQYDIAGPFIETLFRVSCLEDGYVPGVRIKRDLFDCIDFKTDEAKEEACRFWKKLAQDLEIQIQGSFDDDFEKIKFKRLSEEEYLKDLSEIGDLNKGEPLTPLEEKVYFALADKFGKDWSYYLMTNVWREIKAIQIYFLEGLFIQTLSEVEELKREKVYYFVPNSGLVGWLIGIGSINPLLHYVRCPKCHYSHALGYLNERLNDDGLFHSNEFSKLETVTLVNSVLSPLSNTAAQGGDKINDEIQKIWEAEKSEGQRQKITLELRDLMSQAEANGPKFSFVFLPALDFADLFEQPDDLRHYLKRYRI